MTRKRNPVRKQAPGPIAKHFIFAKRGLMKLHFDGLKFTSNGKPALYQNLKQAEHVARELLRKFPDALRGYDVYVRDLAAKQ